MTLMDYCMQYIGEIMDGKRAAPEGVTLTETDPMRRSLELMQKAGDIPTLVRMCAAQDGTEIPQEVFDSFDPESLTQLAGEGDAAPEEPEQPQQPDPDAGKHAFQVLLDCPRSPRKWTWTRRNFCSGWATRSFGPTTRSGSAPR